MSGEQPRRVQLRRTKGWRMPENTVSVARPTRWGNPFKIGVNVCSGKDETFECAKVGNAAQAVAAFRHMLTLPKRRTPSNADIQTLLRGKNLACWCRLDQPCHADVLLELANADTPTQVNEGDR